MDGIENKEKITDGNDLFLDGIDTNDAGEIGKKVQTDLEGASGPGKGLGGVNNSDGGGRGLDISEDTPGGGTDLDGGLGGGTGLGGSGNSSGGGR